MTRVRVPSGVQQKRNEFSSEQKSCCADSMSVCRTPVCIYIYIRTHKNDHVLGHDKDPVVNIRVRWIIQKHEKVKDENNVPIALSAFRDKGSRLWSFLKKENKLS